MRITCEHCGTGIDIDKDKRCPNCGASYARNKDYKDYKDAHNKNTEYEFREREADIHSKELQNKIIEKTLNTANKISFMQVITTIIFIVIFVIALLFIFKVFKNLW